MTSQAAKNI